MTKSNLARRWLFITSAGIVVFAGGMVASGLAQTYLLRRPIAGISQAQSGDLPSGMVAAFPSGSCPSGWTAYTAADGRFLVGTGGGQGYSAGQTGGADSVTLTVNQMPSHTHGLKADNGTSSPTCDALNCGALATFTGGGGRIFATSPQPTPDSENATVIKSRGGGEAHENRPPFIAVTFCQKS